MVAPQSLQSAEPESRYIVLEPARYFTNAGQDAELALRKYIAKFHSVLETKVEEIRTNRKVKLANSWTVALFISVTSTQHSEPCVGVMVNKGREYDRKETTSVYHHRLIDMNPKFIPTLANEAITAILETIQVQPMRKT